MVVLMGSLLLSVNHVLCSERDWVCSVMELSGNSVQKPPMAAPCVSCLSGSPAAAFPSHPEFGFQGTPIILFVLCSVPDLFLALLGVTPTPARQDLKGDKLSVAIAFAFREANQNHY